MKFDFDETSLENLQHVIFGLQKQASVQNKAVILIIARELADKCGKDSFASEEEVAKTIEDYVTGVMANKYNYDESAFMLICGQQSLANLEAVGPCRYESYNPSPESPKMLFRVVILGEDLPEEDHSAVTGNVMSAGPVASDVTKSGAPENYKDRVEYIKNKILPSVPAAVKSEVSDEYQQCLCIAEFYYGC